LGLADAAPRAPAALPGAVPRSPAARDGSKPTPPPGPASADSSPANRSQPGTATVSDKEVVPVKNAPPPAQESYAHQVQALQEIKFQQMRQAGIDAQKQATEAFQARDPDRALDILRDYLNGLDDAHLDPEKLVLLRRPVESRLQK